MTAPSDLHGLIERVREFLRHKPLCGIVGGYRDCTCGMEKAEQDLMSALERLSARTDTGGEMVLVPREPTEAMVTAALIEFNAGRSVRNIVHAAIAAAPATADTVDVGEVGRLREALDAAVAALRNYADPTGYTDNLGDPYEDGDPHHPGTLARLTLDKIESVRRSGATA